MVQKFKAFIILGCNPGDTEWSVVDDTTTQAGFQDVIDIDYVGRTSVIYWCPALVDVELEKLRAYALEHNTLVTYKVVTLWGETSPPKQ